jgi:hypothetical protein
MARSVRNRHPIDQMHGEALKRRSAGIEEADVVVDRLEKSHTRGQRSPNAGLLLRLLPPDSAQRQSRWAAVLLDIHEVRVPGLPAHAVGCSLSPRATILLRQPRLGSPVVLLRQLLPSPYPHNFVLREAVT